MIYLMNISDAQILMIPKNGGIVTGEMSLVLRNTTDQQETTLSVTDLNTSGLYFNLAVALPEGIADGEYQYTLKNGNIQLSCGLLYIGDLQSASQYERTITYQQYESE